MGIEGNPQFAKISCYMVDVYVSFVHFIEKNENINNTCGETFPGVAPLSEIETVNVVKYLTDHSDELVSYFDIHSYSQLFLSPWGRTSMLPPDYSIMVSSG